jgi:hypothetical protein
MTRHHHRISVLPTALLLALLLSLSACGLGDSGGAAVTAAKLKAHEAERPGDEGTTGTTAGRQPGTGRPAPEGNRGRHPLKAAQAGPARLACQQRCRRIDVPASSAFFNHKKQRLAKKAVFLAARHSIFCVNAEDQGLAEIPSSWKRPVPAHRWFLRARLTQGSNASPPQNRYGGFSP